MSNKRLMSPRPGSQTRALNSLTTASGLPLLLRTPRTLRENVTEFWVCSRRDPGHFVCKTWQAGPPSPLTNCPTLPLRTLSPREARRLAQGHASGKLWRWVPSDPRVTALPLPWLPQETALSEFPKALCDKDCTLSDYRKKEIILISPFKSRGTPAKVGSLFKNALKARGIRHKRNPVSEGALMSVYPLFPGGVGAGSLHERATRLCGHHSPPPTSLWRNEILQLVPAQ